MLKCHWLAQDIATIPGFFSAEECERSIAFSEAGGYEEAPVSTASGMVMMKDVRNNSRVMVDDVDGAARLYARIEPLLPVRIQKKWRPVGLNERLRYYRYDAGQQFDWHQDGYFERPTGERSFFTFMIYLNDGFEGGHTTLALRNRLDNIDDRIVVSPKQGTALIFRHPIRHKGEPVSRGRKYVLRTDVMCAQRA